MDLKYQIEQQKKKSNLICDFVIDTTYIKELACQVLNADEKTVRSPSFQKTCETLNHLCDQVAASVITLKEMLPAGMLPAGMLPAEMPPTSISPSPDPETMPPTE